MSHQLIVAIGRESGSGGLDIAHALAERLQLPLFDKSILQKAAEGKGVSAETLERYDERPYSPLFCRSVRGISSAPEDCVAQMQFELLRQHANAGESFVVLGRCAEEVLADREGLVSVFVRADLDFRVKRTPLPEEEALDFIKHQDRQRRIYHDQHCKGDWGDAKCYDLVINTVPARVLGQTELEDLRPDCLVLDLASRPGGVDLAAAGELGLTVIWALSLPGKVAPVSAGAAIKRTIYNMLSELGL